MSRNGSIGDEPGVFVIWDKPFDEFRIKEDRMSRNEGGLGLRARAVRLFATRLSACMQERPASGSMVTGEPFNPLGRCSASADASNQSRCWRVTGDQISASAGGHEVDLKRDRFTFSSVAEEVTIDRNRH